MKFGVRVSGLSILDWKTFEQPLASALRTSITSSVYGLQKEIAKGIKDNFLFYGDPNKVSSVYFRRKAGRIFSAELSYAYKAIPLSRYPVKQYRVTTGKKILRVSRGGSSAANKFTQKTVSRANIATYVQIRKTGGMKLVHGKLGYMGWLHTGRKRGELGYYGQANLFSSKIFERNQQETWSGGERLPVHQLFGPSVTDLIQTKEIQNVINHSENLRNIDKILLRNLKF